MSKSPKLENHFFSLIIFLISYSLSYLIFYALTVSQNFLYPQIFGLFTLIAFHTYVIGGMVILTGIAKAINPSIASDSFPSFRFQVLLGTIISLGFSLEISSLKISYSEAYTPFINLNLFYLLIIHWIITVLGVFLFHKILYSQIVVQKSKFSIMVQTIKKEILLMIFASYIIILLIINGIFISVEFIELSTFVKMLTVTAFYFATQPEE